MIQTDASELLAKLTVSFEKIRTLIAWRQLKLAEIRPGTPPSFVINDDVEEDLRNHYSLFIATASKLHILLRDNRMMIPTAERESIRAKLARLEHQLRCLNLSAEVWPHSFF